MDFKKHKTLLANFNKEYVATEIFPREIGRKISTLALIREQSDYNDFYMASKQESQQQVEIAEELITLVREYLNKEGCNGVQREHNKKLNNGLPILHKVPPKRDYGRYFCIMAEKGGTSHGGLTEKLSPFFHAKKQEVNAYGR